MSRIPFTTLLLGTLAAAAIVSTWACSTLDRIDGASVPTVGSAANPPDCDAVCTRLGQLCGYEPVDCRTECGDSYADDQRVCIGLASNCRDALQTCAPADSTDSDGGDDADTEGGDVDADGGDVDAGDDTDGALPDQDGSITPEADGGTHDASSDATADAEG